jgi:hypothetical protein
MQHVYSFMETHGVDGSICVALEIIDQFDGPASETFERLGGRRVLTGLHEK